MDRLFTTSIGGALISDTSPGCAAALSDGGRLVHSGGYGLANLETGVAMTPDSVIDIASVSKQFTAAAVLLLVQDGRVSMDDEIHEYVPELPDYEFPMRLRDLMHMESGLPDYLNAGLMEEAGFEIDEPATIDDKLAVITKVRALDFEPGTEHAYSNSNYVLLRLVVERKTGQSLADFAAARIFQPLAMSETSFYDESKGPFEGAAVRYVVDANFERQGQPMAWDNQGDAGVFSNVLDLLRWGDNFWSGTVGGPDFLRAQLEGGAQRVPVGQSRGTYAAGVVLSTYHQRPLIWHTGGEPGLVSALIVERDERRAVALICNSQTVGNPFFLAFNALDAWFGT